MTTQPVWSANLLVAIVTAVIALLVAFGFNLSDEQTAAILGLVGVLAPIVAAYWSNQRTTPLVDPKDEDGEPLVRQDTKGQTRSAVRKANA